MIFGFRVDSNADKVDGLVAEWNEIFQEPTRKIISETKYYKGNDKLLLPKGEYLMSIKPMFPFKLWAMVLAVAILGTLFFGIYKATAALTAILLVLIIFNTPYLYFLGTKSRLKRKGFTGKIEYINIKHSVDNILREAYPDESQRLA